MGSYRLRISGGIILKRTREDREVNEGDDLQFGARRLKRAIKPERHSGKPCAWE
jgi:hypothetical protein